MLLLALAAIVVLYNSRGLLQRVAARLRDWLEQTHSSMFELCRHFCHRFFDSELIADPSQARVVAGGAIGILVSLSLLFGQAYYHKYRALAELDSPEPFHRAVLGDVLFLTTLTMVGAALFTTIEWPALFPSLRDYLALASLPVRMREIFTAKFLALVAVALAVLTASALPPSVIVPAMMYGPYAAGCGWHVFGIFAASLAGGWFVFLTLVAVQGVLLNLLPIALFPRVSLALQGIFLALLLAGLPVVFSIPTFYNRIDAVPAWAVYAPPFWFFAVDQIIFGARDPATLHLAGIAAIAVVGCAAAAIGAYLWSYRRHRVRVLEAPSPETAAARLRWPPSFSEALLRGPRALGVFGFIAKSLARSRQHRLILIAFGAVALALISEGFSSAMLDGAGLHANVLAAKGMREAIIAVPLALSLLLLSGLRYVFRLPVDLRANWLFRITEPGHVAELASGIERFMFCFGAFPVLILTLPMEISLLGARAGLAASILCLLISMLLIEVLLVNFSRIPFTSSYIPGRRTLIQTVILCAAIALCYVAGLAGLVSLFAQSVVSSLLFAATLAIVWWRIHRARLDSDQHARFEFEESLESTVQLLAIERD